MNPIILGDGLLGSELSKQSGWYYISRKSSGFDFSTQIEKYFKFILDNKFDTVINCIACTNTYGGTEDEHRILNYERVQNLVDFCNKNKIKLVHISTDYLYSNSKPNAKETDDICPINTFYGQFKNYGDFHVQMFSENYLTIRTSFKPNPFPYDNAVNQTGNFDYVDVIANLIIKLIEKDAKGIFNVGTKKKSMYTLAKKTRPNVGKIENNNPLMPTDISMNLTKLRNFLK